MRWNSSAAFVTLALLERWLMHNEGDGHIVRTAGVVRIAKLQAQRYVYLRP